MKRGTTSTKPLPRKPKPKLKVKSKEKRFDPLEYLNSLIDDIQDHSQPTTRKRTKSSTKRQLVSAMAQTIPHTERSIGCSKVRSKSSYSQPRRKSLSLRDPLKINLNMVTQEDNIQFTESTIRQYQKPPSRYEAVYVVVLTRSAAARKIQRAWRNYQTLKVVRKYYEFYQGIIKRQQLLRELQSNNKNQQQPTVKRSLQHTLKIRRQLKNSQKTADKQTKSVFRALDFSQAKNRQNSREIEFFMDDLRTLELPALRDTEPRQETVSKELQLIVDLFHNTHEVASKEIQNHFSQFYKAQGSLVHSLELTNKEEERGSSLIREDDRSLEEMEGMSPLIFEEMENAVRHKYELLKSRMEDQMMRSQDRKRGIDQLDGRLHREMRAIDRCKQQYLKSVQQLKESMLKMQNDAAKVTKLNSSSTVKVRKSYSADTLLIKSIFEEVSFKNMDLDISKDELPFTLNSDFKRKKRMEQRIPLTIPTSPPSVAANTMHISSTGKSEASLVCYEMDSDIKLRQAILDCSDGSSVNCLFKDEINEIQPRIKQFSQESEGELDRCDSTSSIGISIPDHSFKEGENSRMVRECSEQIEQKIETLLIDEIVTYIYKQQKLWSSFKSMVQDPFVFKAQTDQNIKDFLQRQIPKFYGSELQILQRINQKINPTSLEILRLIRDYDFQIDQYELILPEEVFKAFRKQLEEKYIPLIKTEKEKEVRVQEKLTQELKKIVLERGNEKKVKTAKFLGFERDLKIMYFKAVFNCYNQMIIQTKSAKTYMNCRSSIGPGELTLALKQYNTTFNQSQAHELLVASRDRIFQIVEQKCIMPEFKSSRQIETFQSQISHIIGRELQQTEYKWVNYMDEVLQLWQKLALWLSQQLFIEAANDISSLFI